MRNLNFRCRPSSPFDCFLNALDHQAISRPMSEGTIMFMNLYLGRIMHLPQGLSQGAGCGWWWVHVFLKCQGLFPCSSKIENLLSCVPVLQYCLCLHVPLKVWHLFPCSLEINALFPQTNGRSSPSISCGKPFPILYSFVPCSPLFYMFCLL